MLHSMKDLIGCEVRGTDGEVGRIDDVYFDDEHWVLRYLVVNTGNWLTGRQVLLSPYAFRQADWEGGIITMNLTRDKIRDSPGIDTHQPVSRRQESELFRYYGYPAYWAGPYAWGFAAYPVLLDEQQFEDATRTETREQAEQDEDRHLRSISEVRGYAMHATDDTLGHLEDLLFDEEDWSVQLVVVDPRNWWPNNDVLIPPARVTDVDWGEKSVRVNMSRAEIESSPEYDPEHPPLSQRPQPDGIGPGARVRPR